MNMFHAFKQVAAVGVNQSKTIEGLNTIHDTGCAATIWNRTPLESFQTWINTLDPDKLPTARMILRPDRAREALEDVANLCGTPKCAERDMLIDDVAALAMVFADVMDAPYLRLRLDVITTNACRKFHIDGVTARLVCTYRGTGTQYGNSPGKSDPEEIFTVSTGSPIVLRGTKWPTTPETGLLHRSPPIEGSGETRLLLVLDPVVNLEETPDVGERTLH